MKTENIFWPVLLALVVFTELPWSEKNETLTAYYADGTRVLFHADPVTQLVATFAFDKNGRPAGYGSSGLSHGCQVGDYRNWSCPAVVSADGVADAQYGFTQAVDGSIDVTDPKKLVPPVSWLRWKLGNIERFFQTKVSVTQ